MAKENLIWKLMFYGSIFPIMLGIMNSCSKDKDQTESKVESFTVDLSNPKYAPLLEHLGYMAITEKGLVITNWLGGYACAVNSCSNCSSSLKGNNQPGASTWICESCKSEFSDLGEVRKGPAINGIKTYPVVRSGNILTIKLTK